MKPLKNAIEIVRTLNSRELRVMFEIQLNINLKRQAGTSLEESVVLDLNEIRFNNRQTRWHVVQKLTEIGFIEKIKKNIYLININFFSCFSEEDFEYIKNFFSASSIYESFEK